MGDVKNVLTQKSRLTSGHQVSLKFAVQFSTKIRRQAFYRRAEIYVLQLTFPDIDNANF